MTGPGVAAASSRRGAAARLPPCDLPACRPAAPPPRRPPSPALPKRQGLHPVPPPHRRPLPSSHDPGNCITVSSYHVGPRASGSACDPDLCPSLAAANCSGPPPRREPVSSRLYDVRGRAGLQGTELARGTAGARGRGARLVAKRKRRAPLSPCARAAGPRRPPPHPRPSRKPPEPAGPRRVAAARDRGPLQRGAGPPGARRPRPRDG
jgi:hypothetical protein